jgi:hypothetical protein
VARDATARQYDVDADAVRLDLKKGEITFRAKKGRLVSLDKIHESIWATRLSGRTGMSINWIDVTAVGEVEVEKDRIVLKVTGSDAVFVLKGDDRLRAAARGPTKMRVTGRVEGWTGHFPPFLKTLPKKPRVIEVKGFEPMK